MKIKCVRLAWFILAVCMILTPVSAFAADDNVNVTGMPIVKEPVTMDMMIRVDTARGINPADNEVFKYLETLTGIHWNFVVVDSTAWSEKLNLTWASGNLPDMIYLGVDMAAIKTYTGRQILDIAPYLPEYAPNISALMEKSEAVNMAMVQPDGKVGTFVWTNMDVDVGSGQCPPDILYINQEWLDKLGLPMPQTVEAYIETLKAFRDKDPNGNGLKDEIPLAPRYAWSSLHFLQPLSGFMSGNSGAGGNGSDYNMYLDGDTVQFAPFLPEYRSYMEMLAMMYKEKLIDPEIFTLNNQQVLAKGNTETPIYGSVIASAAFTVVGDKHADSFVPAPIYTAANGKQMWYTRVFANPGVGVITSSCKYPEAAVRWCDLFYQAEYEKLVWMGIEGEAYQYADDTRTTWNWILTDDAATANDVRAKRTIQAGGQGPSICPVDWFNLNDAVEAPVNAQRKQIGTDYFGKLRVAMPALYYDTDAQKELTALWTDVKSYLEQQTALFITGELDIESNWDMFQQQLRAMGAERISAIGQQAYDLVK